MRKQANAGEGAQEFARRWCGAVVRRGAGALTVSVESLRQGWGDLQFGRSLTDAPLRLGGREFAYGLGTHADSEIRLRSEAEIARFRATAGVDDNVVTAGTAGEAVRVVFAVEAGGRTLWRSAEMNRASGAVEVDVRLPRGTRAVALRATAVDGNLHCAHADWAAARVTTANGATIVLGDRLFADHPLPLPAPFTFVYDGRPSRELLPQWKATYAARPARNGMAAHAVTWRDPRSGLECRLEMREFADYPAVEWVVHFRNAGKTDTAIIADIQALDATWAAPAAQEVSLYRSRGSQCRISDFEYLRETLGPGCRVAMAAGGGRSSNDWLPFFNLDTGSLGIITAIGWTGQWACEVARAPGGEARMRAGIEKTHLRLRPGESIRGPRVLQLFWTGDRQAAHNTLRRFLLAHHVPRVKGKPVVAPLTTAHWGGMRTEGHLERIAIYKRERVPHEYYWVDAGWYGLNSTYSPDEFVGDWAKHTGDWRVNPTPHPKGLRPISTAARKAGMKFLLWIEPERAVDGTFWTQRHPDWFLGRRGAGASLLLNLGNPQARRGAIALVSKTIRENRIGCYRQDFNMDPLPFWRANDAPDRQGMTEIRYVEGLYAFWDALLARHPGLLIDNCSSGGRRIDLETISRSIPLWRSDWQCRADNDPIGGQTHGMGLSYWIPLHGTGTYNSMPTRAQCDTYRARSAMSPAWMFGAFPYESTPIDPQYPWDWYRRMAADYLRARPLFAGDYYPLTPARPDPAQWAVYQMHRPDLNEGFVMALRRKDAPWERARFRLTGLEPKTVYEVENADTARKRHVSGQTLMETGIDIELPQANESAMVFYRRAACRRKANGRGRRRRGPHGAERR